MIRSSSVKKHNPGTDPEADAVQETGLNADLPPAYSVIDPNASISNAILTHAAEPMLSELKVDVRKPSELVATKEFGLDRPIYFHTNNVSSSSLIVERQVGSSNQNAVTVIAEVSSATSDIKDRCTVTMDVNKQGEYDVFVDFKWTILNAFSTQCKFILRVPAAGSAVHPGIRAEISNDHFGMGHLHHTRFEFITVRASGSYVSLSGISAQRINVDCSNKQVKLVGIECHELCVAASDASIEAVSVQSTVLLDLKTTNGKLTITDLRSPIVYAKTSNSKLSLENVTAGKVDAITSGNKIKCSSTTADHILLKTSNSAIETEAIAADSLELITSNSSIKGDWFIKNKLNVKTTNSKIAGTVKFKDPLAHSVINLTTSNSRIDVSLPVSIFCGIFDAKTTNSSVNVEWPSQFDGKEPFYNYIVNTKSYKRGSVGSSVDFKHDLVAKTSNSDIDVKFIAESI
ncbi:hypothetical protein IWW36_000646 [Coemansia brasiliensis]|uniref:Adhesin domain-containing protein n=1 Tax=Coemansia brasiliensis TaxID=2650707 RepID=A0A9W8M1N4_9FUNG|nr:hypothetical protein IWW36_000646 [Coemansia brasiliensis]